MATTPIVFKSLGRTEASAKDALKLTFCNIEYHKSNQPYGHYLLASHEDPFNPIKLYQSAVEKLPRNLRIAFEEVQQQQDEIGDNEVYDCGVINSHDKMDVRLVLIARQGSVQVWLKIYTRDENNVTTPTKYGVQFSTQDNLDALAAFFQKHKMIKK
jgi:hypothetical protein